jgi:hypothetical protein
MSGNFNVLETGQALGRAVEFAIDGNQAGVLREMEKCDLNPAQREEIHRILASFNPQDLMAEPAQLKEQVLAVLNRGNIGEVDKKAQSLFGEITEDIFGQIVLQCDDAKTWISLSCASKEFSSLVPRVISQFPMGQIVRFCGPNFRMISVGANSLPFVNFKLPLDKFKLVVGCRAMVPHVENNEGVSYLRIEAGTTLNQVLKIAKEAGIDVDIRDLLVEQFGDLPVLQTEGALVTNHVFNNSRNKSYEAQAELVKEFKCELPRLLEATALCVFTQSDFKRCLYGKDPWTFTRCFERVSTWLLVVGGSAPSRLGVSYSSFDDEDDGAGGRRKF